MKNNTPIAFWETNCNSVTMFKSTFQDQSKRAKRTPTTLPFITVKDFVESDYTESRIIADELNFGTMHLHKLMKDLGHDRYMHKGKKYFRNDHIQELRESDLLNVKYQSKLDTSWMVSSTELAEQYNVLPWQRHKIVEASGLKPIMRSSGRVYFDKAKLIPFF